MEVIRNYLDNIFVGMPNTEQVKRLKQNMEDSMEEKCQELIEEGKTAHEAAYSVIANFGSMDEIMIELGITQEEKQKVGRSVSEAQVEAYLKRTKKDGIWIGSGIWLILSSVALLILLGGNTAGLFALFGAITIAVGIFFARGIPMSACDINNEQAILLEEHTKAEIELRRTEFMPRFTVQIVVGVMLILLAIGATAVFTAGAITLVTPALLVFMVGLSIFLFVTAGMTRGAYDHLLAKNAVVDLENRRKSDRLIGAIAAAYWPLVTAIYLGWSFLQNAWDISWVVWPVAGCIFAAIAGGIGAWGYTEGGRR